VAEFLAVREGVQFTCSQSGMKTISMYRQQGKPGQPDGSVHLETAGGGGRMYRPRHWVWALLASLLESFSAKPHNFLRLVPGSDSAPLAFGDGHCCQVHARAKPLVGSRGVLAGVSVGTGAFSPIVEPYKRRQKASVPAASTAAVAPALLPESAALLIC